MRRNQILIEPRELTERLGGSSPPVVADCRFALEDPAAGERAYAAGHVPGAHYLHLDRDLAAPRGPTGGRHPLPAEQAFTVVMRRIGLCSSDMLVAYDDSRGAYAARLWWLARYFGHPEVRILDGGWGAWLAAGGGRGERVPKLAPGGDFVARGDCMPSVDQTSLLRELGGVRPLMLVDSRDARRYAGIEEPIDPVAGHIPGAINRPWAEATDAGGRFLPADAQRARWSELRPDAAPVVYCGSGVTACVNLVSLALAGFDGARLYPGSWSDWCTRLGAAIATGAEPGRLPLS